MVKKQKSRNQNARWVLTAIIVLMAIAGWKLVYGRPAFDPDTVAKSETLMWQAYYSGNHTQLGMEIITLLRSQYGLPLLKAKTIGELLARSSMRFQSANGDYERIVLPDLTEAYRLIQQASGRAFDPEQAARAELAWWVARRTPGQDSAGQVGEKIAILYGLLYGKDHAVFFEAGSLRAEAARLRDTGGKDADWAKVEDLLKKSYRELARVI